MEKHALNLDEMLLEDAKRHLNEFATTYPDEYDEINCDLKQLNTKIVHMLCDYLNKHQSPSIKAKVAGFTGLSRRGVYYFLEN